MFEPQVTAFLLTLQDKPKLNVKLDICIMQMKLVQLLLSRSGVQKVLTVSHFASKRFAPVFVGLGPLPGVWSEVQAHCDITRGLF